MAFLEEQNGWNNARGDGRFTDYLSRDEFFNQAGTGGTASPSCASVNNDCNCYYGGCTDITSPNYLATATCDDGSCTPGVLGCTDPLALGYNSAANMDDGSCGAIAVSGCTDPAASNHNPAANTGCNWQSGPPVPSPTQTAPTQGTQSSFSGYSNFNTGFVPNPNPKPYLVTSNYANAAGDNCDCGTACAGVTKSDCYKCCANIRPSSVRGGLTHRNFNQQGFGGYNDRRVAW